MCFTVLRKEKPAIFTSTDNNCFYVQFYNTGSTMVFYIVNSTAPKSPKVNQHKNETCFLYIFINIHNIRKIVLQRFFFSGSVNLLLYTGYKLLPKPLITS